MDDRGVKASTARTTALLAAVLCAFALLAPTTARAATGQAHTGIHPVTAIAAGSLHQHALTLRADQPHALGAGGGPAIVGAFDAGTATSAEITPSYTAGSPRTRGPPAHGCS